MCCYRLLILSTDRLREHGEKDAYQNVAKKEVCPVLLCPCSTRRVVGCTCVRCIAVSLQYSETSPLKTLCDLTFSPYYRGFLNSEVIEYTTVLHWDTEWCPHHRGFHNSEVCNREVPLYVVACNRQLLHSPTYVPTCVLTSVCTVYVYHVHVCAYVCIFVNY